MICLICRQAEPIGALTSVIFERGEVRIEISRVPAYTCPHCGEAYVEEDVAIRLLSDAEKASV
jgi:YgiT-type zinc finger domain-containing protein